MSKVLITFLLTISFSSIATVEEEAKAYTQQLKNREVEKELRELDQYKECEKKYEDFGKGDSTNYPTEADRLKERNKKRSECINKVIESTDEKSAYEISKQLDLNNYDLVESKTGKSIKKYLSKRFNKMVHGDENTNDLKKKKFVSQQSFFEMYRSTLDKGILFELSSYCLEKLRVKSTGDFLQPVCTSQPINGRWSGCFTSDKKVEGNHGSIENLIEMDYDYANASDPEDAKKYTAQTQKKLDEMIEKEFQRGPEYLQAKYAVCVFTVKKMCDRYECDQTIRDPGSTQKCINLGIDKSSNSALSKDSKDLSEFEFTEAENVSSDPSLIPEIDKKKKYTTGRVACNLMSELRKFRNAYTVSERVIEKFKKEGKGTGAGYDVNTAFAGSYDSTDAETGIQALTTISSGEMTANTDEIADFDEAVKRADELAENCKKGNEKDEVCTTELDYTSEEKIANIEADAKAQYGIKKKSLEYLEKNPEKLKVYLETNGMVSLLDQLEKGTLKQADLLMELDAKFKAEQLAMITNLKKEFGSQKKIKTLNDGTIKNFEGSAKQSVNELKAKKARISTLLQYNNIVTSFLEHGPDKAQNVRSFNREVEDLKKYDPENVEYEKYFSDLEGEHSETDKYGQKLGLEFINKVLNGASIDNEDEEKKD